MDHKKESDVFKLDEGQPYVKDSKGEHKVRLYRKGSDVPMIADAARLEAMALHSKANGVEPDISEPALKVVIAKNDKDAKTETKARPSAAFKSVAAKPGPTVNSIQLADLKNPAVSAEIARQGRKAKLGVATI